MDHGLFRRVASMKKESTTFGLVPDKLAKLWTIGGDQEGDDIERTDDQIRSELLHDLLADKMPIDQALTQIMPEILAQMCEEIKPFAGNSFSQLILNPDADLLVLKRIKDFTKDWRKKAVSDFERDVIAVIYYAAIASALVYHGQRITSFSRDALNKTFSSLIGKNWLTGDLKALFKRAIDSQNLAYGGP
jgi:hypothetical protein